MANFSDQFLHRSQNKVFFEKYFRQILTERRIISYEATATFFEAQGDKSYGKDKGSALDTGQSLLKSHSFGNID